MTAELYENLTKKYRENLEEDIIRALSAMSGLSVRDAMDAYYNSRLATQIAEGRFGIDNLDPRYLAADLLENEDALFVRRKP